MQLWRTTTPSFQYVRLVLRSCQNVDLCTRPSIICKANHRPSRRTARPTNARRRRCATFEAVRRQSACNVYKATDQCSRSTLGQSKRSIRMYQGLMWLGYSGVIIGTITFRGTFVCARHRVQFWRLVWEVPDDWALTS